MQTNRDRYNITVHPTRFYIGSFDQRCAQGSCDHCRHSAYHRDLIRYPRDKSCAVSWLNAPHDQPLDVREPWPPPADPNPL